MSAIAWNVILIVASWIIMTIYNWIIYWRDNIRYSLFDVLMTPTEESGEAFVTYIIKWIPWLNVLWLALMPLYMFIKYGLIRGLFPLLKKIEFGAAAPKRKPNIKLKNRDKSSNNCPII